MNATEDSDLASIRRNNLRVMAIAKALLETLDVAGDGLLTITGLPPETRVAMAEEAQEVQRLESEAMLAPAMPYRRKRPLWAWNRLMKYR